MAGAGGRGVGRQGRVAVVAARQGCHGRDARRLQRFEAPQRLGSERAQAAVGRGAQGLLVMLPRFRNAPGTLRDAAQVVIRESSPRRVARQGLELAFGLVVALEPVVRRAEVVVQARGIQARPLRFEKRLQRRAEVARAKRGDPLLEGAHVRRGGSGGLALSETKEQRSDDATETPEVHGPCQKHALEESPPGGRSKE